MKVTVRCSVNLKLDLEMPTSEGTMLGVMNKLALDHARKVLEVDGHYLRNTGHRVPPHDEPIEVHMTADLDTLKVTDVVLKLEES